jgi:hypothetical protein
VTEETKRLYAEHGMLAIKLVYGTITTSERERLRVVRQQLDQLHDAEIGPSLDVLERIVEQSERAARLIEQLTVTATTTDKLVDGDYYFEKVERTMTEHELCPECSGRPIAIQMYNDSVPGVCAGFIAGCFYHWHGPMMDTREQAFAAWDKVIGPYWRTRNEHLTLIDDALDQLNGGEE